MIVRAIVTREPIAAVLATLEEPWRAGSGDLSGGRSIAAAGSGVSSLTAAAAGEVGAWLEFCGIVRTIETEGTPAGTDAAGAGGTGSDGSGSSGTGAGEMGSGGRASGGTGAGGTGGVRIRAIDYEAHEDMAVHRMERILEELGSKHSLTAALAIHRIGVVPVGEPSLLVRILAPHRGEALRACAEFIDELKTWVPIWKHPIPE